MGLIQSTFFSQIQFTFLIIFWANGLVFSRTLSLICFHWYDSFDEKKSTRTQAKINFSRHNINLTINRIQFCIQLTRIHRKKQTWIIHFIQSLSYLFYIQRPIPNHKRLFTQFMQFSLKKFTYENVSKHLKKNRIFFGNLQFFFRFS